MIPAIIIITIAFIWLLIETNYMRVRLLRGYPPPSKSKEMLGDTDRLSPHVSSMPVELPYQWGRPQLITLRTEVSAFKIPLLYLGAITAAELIVALVNPLGGIIFHIVLLLGLIFHSSFAAKHPYSKLYLALAMAPLIRLLSLSIPLTGFPQIYWYAITAVPLLAATITVMNRLNLRLDQVGLTLNRPRLHLLIGLTGIPFGIAEFYILRPSPLADSLAWQGLILPSLILLVGTGFMEELVFRGVLQRLAVEALGRRWGIVYIAVLFAALHVGYLSVADFGLVLVAGLFFGWVVQKTGSLVGVTLSHGLTNITLYLIVPFLI